MRVRESDFYVTRPQVLGWRGISLLVPAVASAVGFFSFAVLGFGFTELNALPQSFRTTLVLVGAFALAFGGEIGTLSNTVEIFRKHGQQTVWDWSGLAISVLSTLAAFLLAFAAILGVRATWADWLQLYGPVLLGLLAAMDSYGGFVEFGLYLNSFDERMRGWREQFEQFKRDELDIARRQRERERAQAQRPTPDAQASNTETETGFPAPVEMARAAKSEQDAASKAQRLDALLDIFGENPHAQIAEAARQIRISRTTAYTYLGELEQSGRIRRNGDGVEVLTH